MPPSLSPRPPADAYTADEVTYVWTNKTNITGLAVAKDASRLTQYYLTKNSTRKGNRTTSAGEAWRPGRRALSSAVRWVGGRAGELAPGTAGPARGHMDRAQATPLQEGFEAQR